MAHRITITLPDKVYEQLCRRALVDNKSVIQLAEETLQNATLSEEPTSSPLDADFSPLAKKSDVDLWQIARSQLPPAKIRRFKRLINKHEAGQPLAPDEKAELEMLIEEGERLTAIKSEAYVLLKQRGHHLPNWEELQKH
ncbi:MAG: hypothetical protein O7E52_24585 [Candidatus Poribacteria bacterium]|nr:hypothetical protein [Candidatus Poribacteria bacterium]